MNDRKKHMAAVKRAGEFSSATAGATTSAFDCLGMCVKVPAFIKWPVVALTAVIAGKVGYSTSMRESAVEEKKALLEEDERKKIATERASLLSLAHDMHDDLLEMKKELQTHHDHYVVAVEHKGDEPRLTRMKSTVDKLMEVTQTIKARTPKPNGRRISIFAAPTAEVMDGLEVVSLDSPPVVASISALR